ncbi:aspartate/glutamate racemase family protein [Allokutzneria sp. A3M-2-11 16]|uniref:aspartate/glutamate racemase family protein n=1 Tax=Allokutzneria sp. A3M-2-11 16 TaxID=2962043 RepID=UPI0020B6EE39|nr:aspartate/glutamate racemase family protein [Allokutzneria sp. A3M-2-11 16]MCP3804602.1 aspartate/glutamate racemase family protein [Allokutzneria sp. A3M-2-11 16]
MLTDLATRHVPDAELVHSVDGSLLRDTIAHGVPPGHVRDKLAMYARFARECEADVLLVTCSSIGEAAEQCVGVPVLRIDEPMCREAVSGGRRIGVLATVSSTLDPTTRSVRRAAASRGVERDIRALLCEGAFDALKEGDTDTHDALVTAAFRRLSAEVDVIVLAQASMARIVSGLAPDSVTVPVLSSPESGIAQLKDFGA